MKSKRFNSAAEGIMSRAAREADATGRRQEQQQQQQHDKGKDTRRWWMDAEIEFISFAAFRSV